MPAVTLMWYSSGPFWLFSVLPFFLFLCSSPYSLEKGGNSSRIQRSTSNSQHQEKVSLGFSLVFGCLLIFSHWLQEAHCGWLDKSKDLHEVVLTAMALQFNQTSYYSGFHSWGDEQDYGYSVISCMTGYRNQVLFIKIFIEVPLYTKWHVKHCGSIQRWIKHKFYARINFTKWGWIRYPLI